MKKFLIILMLAFSAQSFAVESKYYGEYTGLSLDEIFHDKSFNQSLVQLSINSKGMVQTRTIGNYRFNIFYSNDWLYDAGETEQTDWKDHEAFPILLLRENPLTYSAQSIFHYQHRQNSFRNLISFKIRKFFKNKILPDLVQTTSGNLPTNSGYFFFGSVEKNMDKLQLVFSKIQNEEITAKQISPISSEEYKEYKSKLSSYHKSNHQKMQILTPILQRLNSTSDLDYEKRLNLLKLVFTKTQDPRLVADFLAQLLEYPVIPELIPFLIRSLDTDNSKISSKIQEILRYYQDEIFQTHSELARFQIEFPEVKTLNQIYKMTRGIVTAEQYSLIQKYLKYQQEDPIKQLSFDKFVLIQNRLNSPLPNPYCHALFNY